MNFTHAQSRHEQVRWQETGAKARVAGVRNPLTSRGARNIVMTTGKHPTESMTLLAVALPRLELPHDELASMSIFTTLDLLKLVYSISQYLCYSSANSKASRTLVGKRAQRA